MGTRYNCQLCLSFGEYCQWISQPPFHLFNVLYWATRMLLRAKRATAGLFVFNCPLVSKHQRTTDAISLCTYFGLFYLINIRKDTTRSWHCNATPLTIRSEWISQTKAAKLLGVQIDNHMSRNEHVSSVIEKSCSAVHGLITLRRHGRHETWEVIYSSNSSVRASFQY